MFLGIDKLINLTFFLARVFRQYYAVACRCSRDLETTGGRIFDNRQKQPEIFAWISKIPSYTSCKDISSESNPRYILYIHTYARRQMKNTRAFTTNPVNHGLYPTALSQPRKRAASESWRENLLHWTLKHQKMSKNIPIKPPTPMSAWYPTRIL